MFASIGPVWDGNEVWLVVAGGATFAAFPGWYASMFSGFYLALLLVLVVPDRARPVVRVADEEREPRLATRLDGSQRGRELRRLVRLGSRPGEPAVRRATQHERRLHRQLLGSVQRLHAVRRRRVRAPVHLPRRDLPDAATTGTICASEPLAQPAGSRSRPRSSPRCSWSRRSWWPQHNDKSEFPPVLPAVLANVGLLLAVVMTIRSRHGWAFVSTGCAAVLMMATLFTSLYPRVMVSRPNFAEQPDRRQRVVGALHAGGDDGGRADR